MSEPEESTENPPPLGVLSSLRLLLVTLLQMSHTRLQLLLIELQDGIETAIGALVWTIVALLAAGAALFIGGLALIFAFWDTHRLLVTLLLMGAYLAIAIGAGLAVQAKLRARYTLFAASLTELAKDRAMMKERP